MIVGHLKHLEGLDREHIETCVAIYESLGDKAIADGGCVEHGERASSGHAPEVILGVEGDGVLGPPMGAHDLKLREGRIHLTRQ